MLLIQGAQLVPFNSSELVGERPRNAAIATFGSRRFMVYRQGPLGQTIELRLCELDKQYAILSDRTLLNGTYSYEDPRLTLLNDRLWVSYHMAGKGKRSIGIAEVLPDAATPIGTSWIFPQFQMIEKNWVPLAWDGHNSWTWSYQLDGRHIVKILSAVTQSTLQTYEAIGCPPQYGQARGGTNFYPWSSNELLTIAHSSISVGKLQKRYVAFPVLLQNKPPYTVLRTGSLLMAGDEFAGGYPNAKQMKKAVVFPCGLDGIAEGFVISLGYNDREVRLVELHGDIIEAALQTGSVKNPLKQLKECALHC